ncbi:MAG: ATP-binding cassette domain-containing protein [Bryobacteraceae bacterium]
MAAVVEFRDVHYSIGGRAVLRGLNFEVGEGETVSLLGRSGSGKTTALRLVNGVWYPAAGEVRVAGVPTRQWDPVRLKRGIGYVIQDIGLFPHFTVARNVGLVPRLEGWPEGRIDARVRELLSMLELEPDRFMPRYPKELSGGQRQRVGVARALAADPPVLLLDEPFGALDPVTRTEVQRQFRGLSARLSKTAIFVTHDVREALLLGTRVGVLHEGRLEVLATPDEFRRSSGEEARRFLSCLE